MAGKNLWSKSRKKENAYAVVETMVAGEKWIFYVLKAYQCRRLEKANKYARLFCQVITPMTSENGDMGDTYISEIPMTPAFKALLNAREKAEEAL